MKRLVPLVVGMSLLLTLAEARGQNQPNFSGTWVTASPDRFAGQEETIQHTAGELLLGQAPEGGGHSVVYRLDGSESRNVLTSHGEEVVSVSRAIWEGHTLVIQQVTTYPDGRIMQGSSTFTLNADGLLVREMTVTVSGKAEPPIRIIMRKK